MVKRLTNYLTREIYSGGKNHAITTNCDGICAHAVHFEYPVNKSGTSIGNVDTVDFFRQKSLGKDVSATQCDGGYDFLIERDMVLAKERIHRFRLCGWVRRRYSRSCFVRWKEWNITSYTRQCTANVFVVAKN